MEHEYVPDNCQFRTVIQIRIIQDIPFFGCQIERITVCRFLASVKLIYLVVGILHFLAPMEKGAEEVHRVDDGRVRQWSWRMVDKNPGRIEVGVLLAQQIFVGHIIPETIHLLQCDGFNKEGEIGIT